MFQIPIEIFMGADEQKDACDWIVFVGEQKLSADAGKLVDINPRQIPPFRFPQFGVDHDSGYGVINIGFLVWVKPLINTAKPVPLQNFNHAVPLV